MHSKLFASLFVMLFALNLFSQKEEKVKAKFKDYEVYIDENLFLDATCKKYYGDPCTYSLSNTEVKGFVVRSKSYTTMKKVYNSTSKTWSEVPSLSDYLHITFIDSGEEIYSTVGIVNFVEKLFLANIFLADGNIDAEKLDLFILENGEEEPRY